MAIALNISLPLQINFFNFIPYLHCCLRILYGCTIDSDNIHELYVAICAMYKKEHIYVESLHDVLVLPSLHLE